MGDGEREGERVRGRREGESKRWGGRVGWRESERKGV